MLTGEGEAHVTSGEFEMRNALLYFKFPGIKKLSAVLKYFFFRN